MPQLQHTQKHVPPILDDKEIQTSEQEPGGKDIIRVVNAGSSAGFILSFERTV